MSNKKRTFASAFETSCNGELSKKNKLNLE